MVAGCQASGFERFCPLGGRVGLAFGKPLRRWGQGILSGRQDQIPEGPMQAGRPYGRPTFADLTENLVVPVPPTETP